MKSFMLNISIIYLSLVAYKNAMREYDDYIFVDSHLGPQDRAVCVVPAAQRSGHQL